MKSFASLLVAVLVTSVTNAADFQWVRQLGTAGMDSSQAVATDGLGNVYMTGGTAGSLGGPNAGEDDAFLGKFDTSGNLLWTKQLGTVTGDVSYDLSVDHLGNVYLTGPTFGALGGPNAGANDSFLAKYDTTGNLLWTRQWGSSGEDFSRGVAADVLGNIYITGGTNGALGSSNLGGYDAFVSKFDSSGNLLWNRQLGTSGVDIGFGIAADGLGNVYVSGDINGNFGQDYAGSNDVFLSKFDAAGNEQWTEQLGTALYDSGAGVSADALGNIYISGFTLGSLGGANIGGFDAFVSNYDASGNLIWTSQLGTSANDSSSGVSADGLGGLYVTGSTFGSLGGPNAGGDDAFVSKYDAVGNLLWTKQLGTANGDVSEGVSTDGLGNVFISGYTYGSLGSPNSGANDAFVAFTPEPSSVVLAVVGFIGLAAWGWRRRR